MAELLAGRGLPRVAVDDVYSAPVHLNVGGKTYITTLATLTKFPESKLAKLFNGTLPITLDPLNRHYFLDVDGSVFTHILNFLRHGKLVLPEDFNQFPLLKEQAEFFELEAMSALINPEKNKDEKDCSMEEERVKQLRGRGNRKNRGNKKLVLHPSIQKATEQDEKEEVTAEQEEKEEEVTAEQENKEEVTAKQEEKEEEVIAEQEDKEEVTSEQEDKEEVTAEQEEKEEEVTAEQEKWNVCVDCGRSGRL